MTLAPAAAGLVSTAVLFHENANAEPIPWLWFAISVVLAYLMVSRVRFISGKDVDLQRRRPFVALVIMLVALVLIVANPYTNLFVLAQAYCLHGPLISAWQRQKAVRLRMARRRRHAGSGADD